VGQAGGKVALMQFAQTEEQLALRGAVRDLVAQFDVAYWLEKDRAHAFPTEFWAALGANGWLGTAIPEEYGGAGLGMVEMAMVVEEACRSGAGSTASQLFMLTPVFGAISVLKHGTEAQKRFFLPKIAAGEIDFCMALTEPQAGSNTLNTRTAATAQANGTWRLDGQKTWITGVDVADYILVIARTTSLDQVTRKTLGLSLFIVPRVAPGISYAGIEKMGTNCLRSDTIYFDNVCVPADGLLGKVDHGWSQLLDTLNTERVVTAAGCVATADLAIDLAVRYARERKVFGDAAIGSYQGVQFPLAEQKMQSELARLMNYKAAWLFDCGQECGFEANMAKFAAARAACEAADRAIQTMGGMGFAVESHVERLYRDARLFRFAPVSEEMILNFVAQHTLGMPRSY
jgi:acyl-CoA dehydrogenase